MSLIYYVNPNTPCGPSYPCQLDESNFILGALGVIIHYYCFMIFMKANRIVPDGRPHFAASHLGLFCLPMSHKKDTRFIWVNH